MLQVTEMLIRAKSLIDTPETWIKGDYQKNGSYCALGALHSIIQCGDGLTNVFRQADMLLDEYAVAKGFESIVSFNDWPRITHADVMEAYDHAIERSKASIMTKKPIEG